MRQRPHYLLHLWGSIKLSPQSVASHSHASPPECRTLPCYPFNSVSNQFSVQRRSRFPDRPTAKLGSFRALERLEGLVGKVRFSFMPCHCYYAVSSSLFAFLLLLKIRYPYHISGGTTQFFLSPHDRNLYSRGAGREMRRYFSTHPFFLRTNATHNSARTLLRRQATKNFARQLSYQSPRGKKLYLLLGYACLSAVVATPPQKARDS
ncbi:hypothetical protein GGR58DRAFT_423043 [Xylaria digitata]|nr:hypothetical protein GGR58DRAFT_423043 [Xylaria digitata]